MKLKPGGDCKSIEFRYDEAVQEKAAYKPINPATGKPLPPSEWYKDTDYMALVEKVDRLKRELEECRESRESNLVGSLREAMRLAGFGLSGQGTLKQLAAKAEVKAPARLRQVMLAVLDRGDSLGRIKHFVVLMLENRSFDHMFGLLGSDGLNLEGIDPDTGEKIRLNGISRYMDILFPRPDDPDLSNLTREGALLTPAKGADFALGIDPPHEFNHAKTQLCGKISVKPDGSLAVPSPESYLLPEYTDDNINMQGFANCDSLAATAAAMQCFLPHQLPVLAKLAEEYAVCDAWFSSLPGPTTPNRFFVHAGTSDGRIAFENWNSVGNSLEGFSFGGGTLFDRLDDLGRSWYVFAADGIMNQAYLIEGVDWVPPWVLGGVGSDIIEYRNSADLKYLFNKYKPFYTFIEPRYFGGVDDLINGDYSEGDSMHPKGDVRNGERLVKDVYDALRASDLWMESALIILFDEHGGFFDHVKPPQTVPPDGTDGSMKVDGLSKEVTFDFTRLGVRVPALVVSPWVNRNTIDHTVYDHTSVIRTISKRLDNKTRLTDRDGYANSFSRVFRAWEPRRDSVDWEAPKAMAGAQQSLSDARSTAPLPDDTPVQDLPAVSVWLPGLLVAYNKMKRYSDASAAAAAPLVLPPGIPGLTSASSSGASPDASEPPASLAATGSARRIATLGDVRALYAEVRKGLENVPSEELSNRRRRRAIIRRAETPTQ